MNTSVENLDPHLGTVGAEGPDPADRETLQPLEYWVDLQHPALRRRMVAALLTVLAQGSGMDLGADSPLPFLLDQGGCVSGREALRAWVDAQLDRELCQRSRWAEPNGVYQRLRTRLLEQLEQQSGWAA